MWSLDTETTGLHWQHSTVAFAIGATDGKEYRSQSIQIDPFTRMPKHGFSDTFMEEIRGLLLGEEVVVFQNANFDLKALCRADILDWNEPSDPKFWETILELGHLVHLHDSTDAGFKASLKKLAPKYLEKDYSSMDELDRVVNRCRNFIRHRDTNGWWAVGSETTLPYVTTRFNKADMWLPAALATYWKDQQELQEYMKEDYSLLSGIVDNYLRNDCDYTLELAQGFLGTLLTRHGADEMENLLSMNRDLHPVIWKIETLGVPIHQGALDTAMDTCKEMIKQCHDACNEISGLDKDTYTDTDLRELLIGRFGLKSPHTTEKTGQPSVDQKARESMLEEATDPVAIEFLSNLTAEKKFTTKLRYFDSYRRNAVKASVVPYKLKETDPDALYLFPGLNAVGTGTTRFSSSNPNSQNIESGSGFSPSGNDRVDELMAKAPSMRAVFRPRPGRWWFPIDYSQLQLRIFAAATQDPKLIKSFDDGYDFHDFIAHTIYPDATTISKDQRRIAKNTNFGFIFGASEKKIDKTAGIKGLYKHLMEQFPGAKNFITKTKKQVQETGQVHTLCGYPIHLPLTTSPWGTVDYPAHLAVNYIVQGTEGQLVKRAMFLVNRYLTNEDTDCRIVMNIHDELILDTPAWLPKHIVRKVAALMEEAGEECGITTPVDVELCLHNLSERQDIEL